MNEEKRVRVTVTPERFGCSDQHFKTYIKDKPLKVVKEYSSMITVIDDSGENWNIFNGNYIVSTGL